MPQDIIIVGADGHRRRARPNETLRDGERVLFSPLSLMDALANAATANLHDGYGPVLHRPGHLFGSAADATRLRDAADEAYEERRQRLQDAWRHRDPPPGEDRTMPPVDAKQAPALAADAWEDKKVRLANAWRTP